MDWISGTGKRRKTFSKILKLLAERYAKTLVETGTCRSGLSNIKSDGASTLIFANWAAKNGATLFSIDSDEQAIKTASDTLDKQELKDHVNLINADSIEFLSQFDSDIDFLYLDSLDYDLADETLQNASQEHHLKEFLAIENQLTDMAVVLIDDHDLPNGGKSKLALGYMLNHGWQILMQHYQVIAVKS
ncbi:MAG: class I SAM-dependent methyltransferase [Cyclobacteriaceae bacterium]